MGMFAWVSSSARGIWRYSVGILTLILFAVTLIAIVAIGLPIRFLLNRVLSKRRAASTK